MNKFLLPFLNYKYLLLQLTLREIKARYKQSIMGYAWVLINPLAQLIVYSIVFSIFIRFPTDNLPYPIFLFAGLLPWIFFQSSLTTATLCLVNNDDLIRKVYFPREVLPYAVVASKIIDFFFAGALFLIFIFIYHVSLNLNLPILSLTFLTQLFLTVGLSLMFSTFNLFYRDIQFLINLVLMLWMYLTPIIYPLNLVPKQYLVIYRLNPMVGVVEGYRNALFNSVFDFSDLLIALVISFALFIFGFVIFKRSESVFADMI